MRFTLLRFQELTVTKAVSELRLSRDEIQRVGAENSAQAVTLVAPTGAGKTVMAAAVLEALLFGDQNGAGDPQTTVVWLSDLPNVNEQTRRRIRTASDRLQDRLVQVDTSFRADTLAPGRVYFLNTQKLSATSTLVESTEDRSFTIWEILNRTIARDPSRFLLIIDEAHRGMERTRAAAEEAASIVQRFIFGSPELNRSPVVLGISATPQRFDELVAGAHRTIRRAEADVAEVRASGLIKEHIAVWRPEHGLTEPEVILLQRAAQNLQNYQLRWGRYCRREGLPAVQPLLVVQVEDRTADSVTATNLEQAIEAIEEITGQLHPDSYAHCFSDAPASVVAGPRKVRYLRPADVDGDPQVTVVFFKTSLSTGWDCPRAEVMMSFRTARDATFIAQLVGRMVRTPLARRVDSDEILNTVALYLPKYDRGAVQAIIKQLRAGDPDFLPPVDAEDAAGIVDCDRRSELYDQIAAAAATLRSYVVPRRQRMAPVLRLEKLAGSLSDFELHQDAPAQVELELLDILWARLASRRTDPEFERVVERSRQVGLTSTTLSLLTGQTETTTIRIESTSRSIERHFEQVGARAGAGLHEKLWRKVRHDDPTVSGDTARLYVIATLADGGTQQSLEAAARERFEAWIGRYQADIDQLSEIERQDIDLLLEHADAPIPRALALPEAVRGKRTQRSIDYPTHLYQDTNGDYPETLNEWERDVVETELARPETICWVRNKPRQRWALAIPYDAPGGDPAALYPDFLFFRTEQARVVADIVDPHGVHLEDAPAKARGLAAYAKKHGHLFGRFEMVIYDEQAGRRRNLNLKSVTTRDQVLRVTTIEHLRSLFDLAGG